MVEFVFTGTKENVALAELLVNYHLKQIKELDGLRKDIDRVNPPPRNGQRAFPFFDDFKRDRNGVSDRSRGNFRNNRSGRGRKFNTRRDGKYIAY